MWMNAGNPPCRAVFIASEGVLVDTVLGCGSDRRCSPLLTGEFDGLRHLARLPVQIFILAGHAPFASSAERRIHSAVQRSLARQLRAANITVTAICSYTLPSPLDRLHGRGALTRVLRAARQVHRVDLASSLLITDNLREAAEARSLAVQPVLVASGRGRREMARLRPEHMSNPTWFATDLCQAAIAIEASLCAPADTRAAV